MTQDAPGRTAWERGTDATTAARIRDVVDDAAAVDGVSAVSGHVLDAVTAAHTDWLTIPDGAGGIAGAAVAVGADPAEVVMHPRFRGRGYGATLVVAALDRQGSVWAYGDLPAAAAVARRLRLRRGRVLLQMRRTGSTPEAGSGGPPEPALPAGVRIRTFVPGQDEEAFLAVNARAFAWHPEQGRLDLAGLRSDMTQDWFDPDGFFLAVAGGQDAEPERVVGFHWTKVHQIDPSPGPDGRHGPIGEVYVLGVDPATGIRGLGGPLTAAGLHYLAARDLDTVMLYVEGDNDRAIRLYERFGFRTNLTNVIYTRPVAAAP